MEDVKSHDGNPGSCENSNQTVELESSTVALTPSGSNVVLHEEQPTGSPCGSTAIPRPAQLSHQPDLTEGIMLFKARMVLEARWKEYKALCKTVKDSTLAGGHWGNSEVVAAKQMGYLGFDDENARAHGRRNQASIAAATKEHLKVDAKADLEEAYRKFEIPDLTKDDFQRPEAWFWYQQYHDEDLRKDVVKGVLANLVSPSAKAKAAVESEKEIDEREEVASQMNELERFIKERKGVGE